MAFNHSWSSQTEVGKTITFLSLPVFTDQGHQHKNSAFIFSVLLLVNIRIMNIYPYCATDLGISERDVVSCLQEVDVNLNILAQSIYQAGLLWLISTKQGWWWWNARNHSFLMWRQENYFITWMVSSYCCWKLLQPCNKFLISWERGSGWSYSYVMMASYAC